MDGVTAEPPPCRSARAAPFDFCKRTQIFEWPAAVWEDRVCDLCGVALTRCAQGLAYLSKR